MKVFCTALMCLQFGFIIFWRKDFVAKAAHKMLVKLTPGGSMGPRYILQLYLVKIHKIAKNRTSTNARETIKFYLIKLATDYYRQPSHLLGERASLYNITN